MKKIFDKKSRALSLLIAFGMVFVTTTEGFAFTAESEEEKACEEQAQVIERVTSNDLTNYDVYETKDAIVADGYSSEIIIPKEGDDAIEFDFQDGESLVTAKEYLGNDYDTGEAYLVDSNNQIVSVIDPAWAKDVNGNSVNTHYEVRGNSLVQVVEFDGNTAFPVVADPAAWQITKCAGAISWVIGSTIFAAAKVAKIKKYIKALGGLKKSASKLIGIIKKAKTIAKKHNTSTINVLRKTKYSKELWKGVGSTLMNFGAAVLGVDEVIKQCSF